MGWKSFQRGSPKSMECTTAASGIVIYDHCCILSKNKDLSFYKNISLQRCEQRMLEQRYRNVTIMIINI